MLRQLRFFLAPLLVLVAAVAHGEARPRADVIVVGGGPAGIAAAIEARQHGAEHVVVLEKRSSERSRMQVLSFRRGTLNNLAHLGVELRDGDTVSLLKKRTIIDDVEHTKSVVKPPAVHLAADKANGRVGDLMHGSGAALIPINELERSADRAARKVGGIDIVYDTEVTDVHYDANGVSASARLKDGTTRNMDGNFMVIADGASGPTRRQLGIDTVRTFDKHTRLMLGVFEQPGNSEVVYREVPSTTLKSSRIIKLGAAKKSGVLVAMPPEAQFATPADRDRWFADAAAKVGVSGPMALSPTKLDIELTKATKTTVGDRIAVIGDAARTTHVFTGTGVNFALRDAFRFGDLYARVKDATPTERAKAFAAFGRATERATTLNHKLARDEFPLAKDGTTISSIDEAVPAAN